MIAHGINKVCYRCICRVCGQAGCPHRYYRYKRCFKCFQYQDYKPIIDCDNFYLKCFPKYRIKRIYSKPEVRYVDRTNADDIRVMLSEILGLLKSGGNSSVNDVNCVRNHCICITCPIHTKCQDRCKLCCDYKGQRPVRMCGKRLQIERE